MVLKFEEFIELNEGVQSVVKLSDVRKVLEPFDWKYTRGTGDSCKFSKGKYIVYFHLKHDASSDSNRSLDVGGLDMIRTYIIDEFNKTGDLSTIKAIDWKYWRLPDPLKRELKNINPETGKPFENESEENIGHILQKARMEKDKVKANDKYMSAQLTKIVLNDDTSCYIMMWVNDRGRKMYNTCRSKEDRRPLLKNWVMEREFKIKNGRYYFGKDDLRMMRTRYYEVLSDGHLDKTENVDLRENKKIDKNLEML